MTNSEIILYTTPQGEIKIEFFLQDETIWLTQRAMGELFGVVKSTISEHLSNIYKSGELGKEAGREVNRNLEFYNLDAIISVGYRVNSQQATQFRIWATKTLKEFIIKGFVLNDERLKQGKFFLGKITLPKNRLLAKYQ